MISVADVLDRLAILLVDEDFTRWTKPELLGWINDAVSEIIIRRPAAGGKFMPVTLQAGVMQTLPDTVTMIFDVTRNLPSGKGIHIAERQRIHESEPDWFSLDGTGTIKHYCYDNRVPNAFYVYPPALAGTIVEVSAAVIPDKVDSETDHIDMAELYLSPIVSYAMYRALMKDAEESNWQVSMVYFQAFNEALGSNTQVSVANSAVGAKP